MVIASSLLFVCSCPSDVKANDGCTPVDDARRQGNSDIVLFITTYKPRPRSELQICQLRRPSYQDELEANLNR